MSKVLLLACLAALLGGLPLASRASVSGLVPARTGGFGEMTCQQCHWENPLNDPAGQLRLDGVPQSYTPGEQYLITVTLVRPGMNKAGFQLSAREGGINMNAGTNAGALGATDGSVQTVDQRLVTYIQHAPAGADIRTPGGANWTVLWTAPDEGPVEFHVAANAANGDDSPLGDYIYTAIAHSRGE